MPEIEDTIFPKNLAYLRAKAGLTQAELGEKAGVTWSQISRYESGASRPRKGVLLKLAEALQVDQVLLERGQLVVPSVDGKAMEDGSYYLELEYADLIADLAQQEGKPVDEVLRDLVVSGLSRMTRLRNKQDDEPPKE